MQQSWPMKRQCLECTISSRWAPGCPRAWGWSVVGGSPGCGPAATATCKLRTPRERLNLHGRFERRPTGKAPGPCTTSAMLPEALVAAGAGWRSCSNMLAQQLVPSARFRRSLVTGNGGLKARPASLQSWGESEATADGATRDVPLSRRAMQRMRMPCMCSVLCLAEPLVQGRWPRVRGLLRPWRLPSRPLGFRLMPATRPCHAPWPGAEVPPVFLQILRRLQGMEKWPLPGRAAPSVMPVISSVRARSMMELGPA